MKPIVKVPHHVLTSPTRKVVVVDKKISQIIADMIGTLKTADKPKGVGLAAVQIGINLQIFLMRAVEKDPIRIFINPRITWMSKEVVKGIPGEDNRIEGCLSIPKIWGEVTRHKSVKLLFMDTQGKVHEELFTGFEATIVQHEVDHLNGILFTQRVLEQKGQLFEPKINDKGEEILEPLEL